MRKPFAPWKRQMAFAYALFVLGVAFIVGVGFYARFIPPLAIVFLPILPVLFFYVGVELYQHAQRRRYGSYVEKNAVKKFKAVAPEAWCVEDGVFLGRQGDVDLVVSLANGETCSIEIKSWSKSTGFYRMGKAISQIWDHKEALKADHSFLWLPNRKDSSVVRNSDIVFVGGDVQILVRELKKLDVTVYAVQFKAKPSEALRNDLKQLGFRWSKIRLRWEGRCSDKDAAFLRHKVGTADGQIFPLLKNKNDRE